MSEIVQNQSHIVSHRYSYFKVNQHVAVTVQLDYIVKLCISNHDRHSWKHCGEFECQTYVSMSHQVKMGVIIQVRCQVECIKCISIIVVIA